MLNMIETNMYPIYCDEPEEYDPLNRFLDNADINTLKFVIENLQTIIDWLNPIAGLVSEIRRLNDDEQESILNALKKRRNIKREDIQYVSNIICTKYTRDFTIDNEHLFRYETVQHILCSLNDEICTDIAISFYDMTPIKWNIICQVIRTFSLPNSKSVINFFEKNRKKANNDILHCP